MEISHYFEPISLEGHEFAKQTDWNRIGKLIAVYSKEGDFPDLEGVQLALIGVSEDRASLQNKGCAKAPDTVRDYFFQMFSHWNQLNLADLGNIKKGNTIQDTYFALKEAIAQLLSQNIIPIIIGGSQDLTYANYLAYQNIGRIVNIAAVDQQFDLGNDESDLNSRSYLSHIILHQPNYLFNYANIGYQSFLVDQDAISLMNNLYFDVYRLGNMRTGIEEAEPIIRDADILSFDISAIRQSDSPGSYYVGPNGFFGDEACRLCRYAGMSDKLSSFGLYEINPEYDNHGQTAHLAAQMIWYFIDGFMNRNNDLPEEKTDDYIKFTVTAGNGDNDLVFLKSKKSERWWMEVQADNRFMNKYKRHQYVPCSYQDYQAALNHDIPDRWWKVQQKLM
jgi:arginase family enzyme